MSLLEEIEKNTKKSKTKRIWLSGIAGIALIAILYFSLFQSKDGSESVASITEYTVQKGDISISFSSEGKLIGDDIVNLNFPVNGILENLFISPGQTVSQGELLAELDDTEQQINLLKAGIALDQSIANFDAKKQGISNAEILLSKEQIKAAETSYDMTKTQGDIDISNALISLNNAKLNLELLQNEIALATGQSSLALLTDQEEATVASKQKEAMTEIGTSLSTIHSVLYDIDIVFGISAENEGVNDSYEIYLSAKNSALQNTVEKTRLQVIQKVIDYETDRKNYKNSPDLDEITSYLDSLISITKEAVTLTQNAIFSIQASLTSTTLSQQQIDNFVSDFNNKIDSLKKIVNNLESSQTAIELAEASLNTKVGTTINDLNTKLKLAENEYSKAQIVYENTLKKYDQSLNMADSQVKIAEASLDAKQDTMVSAEEKLYELAIKQAELGVSDAQKKLEETRLYAPFSGTILSVAAMVGELVTADKAEPFTQLAIQAPMIVETQIEEEDVFKVFPQQLVRISLDSADGIAFTGQVFFVASAGEEDANGIVTYKVLISYNHQDPKIKNGMGVSIDFITKEVLGVLVVPVSAVVPYEGTPHILSASGGYISVVPGFTDGKMVEIISGLSKGDKILVTE